MNPGTPLTPAPTQQSAQGVTSVTPNAAPTPPQLPTAPTPAALPTPQANPNYDPSAAIGAISDYYKIPREAALSAAQTQSQGSVTGQQVALQRSNAARQLDPSSYRVVNNPQSQYGVSIIDPTGKQVDLGTYVNLTGENPAQVLAKSTDPHAQQFIQAYNNFQDLLQTTMAASGGDQEAKIKLGEYYAANPGLQGMKPADVSNLFLQEYGQFFGMPQQQGASAPTGTTPSFTSQNGPVSQSPYYQLANYQQLNVPNPITNQLLGGGTNYSGALSQLQSQLTSGG